MTAQLSPQTLSNMQRTAQGWLTRIDERIDTRPKMVYLCPDCDDRHDFEDDAQACCAPSLFPSYVCPVCDEVHDTKRDAADCCAGVDAVSHLTCPVCGTKHDDPHEAADCCLWKDTTPHQRFLIASRLEADPRTTWQEAIEYAMSQPQPT